MKEIDTILNPPVEGVEYYYRYEGYEHIRCERYRVKRSTPCGVWLDMGWNAKEKWVPKQARKAFAYPTVERALESFRMRKLRQVEHSERFRKMALQALRNMEPLLSEAQKRGVKHFLDNGRYYYTFDVWWAETGSGIIPKEDHDMEEHAKRISQKAWLAAMDYFEL